MHKRVSNSVVSLQIPPLPLTSNQNISKSLQGAAQGQSGSQRARSRLHLEEWRSRDERSIITSATYHGRTVKHAPHHLGSPFQSQSRVRWRTPCLCADNQLWCSEHGPLACARAAPCKRSRGQFPKMTGSTHSADRYHALKYHRLMLRGLISPFAYRHTLSFSISVALNVTHLSLRYLDSLDLREFVSPPLEQ
jgi:hypothetical protein